MKDILVGANFVILDGDTFQLQIIVSFVETILINAMLIGNDLSELSSY